MHAIKGSSARKINVLLGRSGPVWQEEFFDHVLRSNESLAEKVEYVCQNPVRAGLVAASGEYRWLWRGEIPVI
jgi:putative transposase